MEQNKKLELPMTLARIEPVGELYNVVVDQDGKKSKLNPLPINKPNAESVCTLYNSNLKEQVGLTFAQITDELRGKV